MLTYALRGLLFSSIRCRRVYCPADNYNAFIVGAA